MPQIKEPPDATEFVDEQGLVSKWMNDSDVQTWWDDYPDTPGMESWTDLRPTSARRQRDVPGAESIEQMDTAVQEREGSAGVVETPKIKGDWLDIAKSQVGSPYVWADSNPIGDGGGPGTGFDCSGFTAWVYSEAFGVALPHLSSAQQSSTQKVSRKNLQPGDLIFYHYTDRNGGGDAADHVEIYIGNGKAIGTPDPDGTVGVQDVDWAAFVGGGRVASVNALRAAPKESPEHRAGRKPTEERMDLSMVPASMGTRPNLADVQVSLLMDGGRESGRKDKSTPEFSGASDSVKQIKAQLYRGFMDAGRPDLAKMVNTKDFEKWIGAEGGWDPAKVSQFFPGHGRNAGLFQFALGGVGFDKRDWVTQDVNHSGGNWTYGATPYEQARFVVKYFNLSPGDIRTYADQARSGTYSGWG